MSRILAMIATAVILTAAPASAALNVYGLRTDGKLVRFNPATPNVIEETITITDLEDGEKLVAIAFDRRTGILFGFGLNQNTIDADDDSGRFYTVNVFTGQAFALQGDGMNESPAFSGLDDRYSHSPCNPCAPDPTDASYGMRVSPDGTFLQVVNTSGDVLSLNLSDGSTSSSTIGISTELPAASADLIDDETGLTQSLFLVIDTVENSLELQRNADSGHIVDLVNPFNGETPESVHIGFDVFAFTGFVSYTQAGITRLYKLELKPWWDDGAGDDDGGGIVPELTTVGIIGLGDVPITSLAVLPGAGYIAVSRGDPAGAGTVKVFLPWTGSLIASFTAFGSGGARVALGDLDGDGFPDVITVPGPGPAASVKVFSGDQMLNEGIIVQIPQGFQPTPFGPSYKGGLFVASANIDPEYGPQEDIVIGTGTGPAKFRIIDGEDLIISPTVVVPGAAFADGGARVAVGFFDEFLESPAVPKVQKKPYVIVGSGAAAPTASRIRLFDAEQILAAAFDDEDGPNYDETRLTFAIPGFTGPIFVAAADLFNYGDRFIVGRGNGSPTVKVINPDDITIDPGAFPLHGTVDIIEQQFQAFGGSVGGARVGAGAINPYNDSYFNKVILAGTGSGKVNTFAGFSTYEGAFEDLFFESAFSTSYTGGVYVAGALGVRSYFIPVP